MNWARIRAVADIEVLASGAARLPALLAALERRGVTLTLLDTPGAEGAASSAAMQVADLNIVPSRPSLFDLWASARTRTAIEEIGAKFVFLLNQCPLAQTARVLDGVEALEEMGGLISPLILARVEYQDAARRGRGVTELNPSGAAAQEMCDLWHSITARLAQAKVGRSAQKAA
jgi:chromosome partitioning protein